MTITQSVFRSHGLVAAGITRENLDYLRAFLLGTCRSDCGDRKERIGRNFQ